MIQRSVLLFPDFPDIGEIEAIRSRFDPAYTKIRPHITLVFPFYSDSSSEEIHRAVQSCITGIPAFTLTLHEISVKNTFLFLLPSAGSDSITALFHALYTGPFNAYLPSIFRQEQFIPHMTIGTCTGETGPQRLLEARSLLGNYTAWIDTVYIETIEADSRSVIESKLILCGKNTV